MDGGAWWAAVHGVVKSRAQLSDFTFTFHFHALEKEMATHSSVLAWKIPGTGEPGGLPSMGSHRVWHDWSDLAAAAAYHVNILFYKLFVFSFLNSILSSSKILQRKFKIFASCNSLLHFMFFFLFPITDNLNFILRYWINSRSFFLS